MRGGNANHVLVLVDGVRVASSTQGVFDFAHVPLEQVERIEIVRGPRAALWGSDAIAGLARSSHQHLRGIRLGRAKLARGDQLGTMARHPFSMLFAR